MSPEAVKQRLIELLEMRFEEEPEYFVVDVKVSGTKVQVFLESDSGINIAKCAQISRYLEKYLDEELLLGEKYVLEVSSPGITSPLKMLRQYKRNIDKEVTVVKSDGESIEGILKEANDEKIVVDQIIKKKKKEVGRETFEIPFSEIKSTTLKLNF